MNTSNVTQTLAPSVAFAPSTIESTSTSFAATDAYWDTARSKAASPVALGDIRSRELAPATQIVTDMTPGPFSASDGTEAGVHDGSSVPVELGVRELEAVCEGVFVPDGVFVGV